LGAGKPTVRRAQFLSGNRMAKKPTPAAERRHIRVGPRSGPPVKAREAAVKVAGAFASNSHR